MSQQEQAQPTVRHIPIFVEGRSEPLVNKIPETQTSHNSSTSTMPEPPRMEMPSHNTSDFFKHGSIFNDARNFLGRAEDFTRDFSPARQVPVFTESGFSTNTVPPSQQTQARGSSQPRQTPSPPSATQQQQQYQQQQAQRFQQQQKEQEAKQQSAAPQDQPDFQSKQPASSANDPISKIQKIQRDVLAIFDQVERFEGGKDGKRDKTYVYLDEMLTQNLLKLDSIDAEDQPQIKSARKEAIKSINHCIAVLEAKAEAGSATEGGREVTGSNEQVPNGTANRTGSAASLSHSSSNSSSQQQQQ
ncbi:BAG domain-containing protein Samui [Malaya genurostris]|uniref:BAG domain-containing protein Samui n=1 Tax=Malaya genurostris TaxID=325434 RepID=UPI0026F38A4A|nr:BAG domain-containing protein Samui [Malaya genurostris]